MYRLALAMGRSDVDALAAGMTIKQLRGWLAYHSVEPWGEERADLRAGIIASTVANAFRGKGPAAKPSDFMPDFTRQPQSQQDMHAVFAAFAKQHNAAQALR